MSKLSLELKDPWKELRKDLFGNVEPEIKLVAVTMPVEDNMTASDVTLCSDDGNDCIVQWKEIEQLPALSASVSYGSTDKIQKDTEKAIKLNKSLIKKGHLTPLESIQFNFHVMGISKACGAQISRHRVGQGHVSASRRFQEQTPQFVYPLLDYIKDERIAKIMFNRFQRINSQSIIDYNIVREAHLHEPVISCGEPFLDLPALHKEDARFLIPVSTATERMWWINARALRDFFRLRLAPDAEWEIRRVAIMIYNIVTPLMPSLFEDLIEDPDEKI